MRALGTSSYFCGHYSISLPCLLHHGCRSLTGPDHIELAAHRLVKQRSCETLPGAGYNSHLPIECCFRDFSETHTLSRREALERWPGDRRDTPNSRHSPEPRSTCRQQLSFLKICGCGPLASCDQAHMWVVPHA